MDPSIAQISTHWARVNANVAEPVQRLSARDLDVRASPGAWPIWAIVACYHAGEVLLMLGVQGHKAIDLWRGVEGKAP